MNNKKTKYIGVIGTSEEREPFVSLAREVGKLLALEKAVVVCGGLGGVMNAVAEGCFSAGGICVGIIPGDARTGSSAYLSVSIPTGLGEGRNVIIVRASDALIAIGGGYGTLSEISLAMKMGKPVIGLETWEGRSPEQSLNFYRAMNPKEAISLALELAIK